MKHNHIDFITLGCSKNLVDSEVLMRQLEANGYTCSHDADQLTGDIAVVNTCGFIGDAKQESINTILELVQAKEEGRISKLYVMGCLSQRYQQELKQEIPQVDKYYGKFDFQHLITDLGHSPKQLTPNRKITTPRHYAYVKIAEGCDRRCAYCAIPLITGHHVSRPMDDILDEVKSLVDMGVKEFQVIEQELTYYGVDLYGKRCIAELVDKMAQIEGIRWIRLHYAYPNGFPYELLDVMKRHKNVCNYLDIALQHIADPVLTRMHRNITKHETLEFIQRIRQEIPDICLRTTLMVGFPGETEADFDELLQFVREVRFERMGAFAYSEEEGTYSQLHYKDDIPEAEKQRRLDLLMATQQRISAEMMEKKIGSTMKVIIDRLEGDYYIARGEDSSPEVDPEVLIKADNHLDIGEFYDVTIFDATEFDLYAHLSSLDYEQ